MACEVHILVRFEEDYCPYSAAELEDMLDAVVLSIDEEVV